MSLHSLHRGFFQVKFWIEIHHVEYIPYSNVKCFDNQVDAEVLDHSDIFSLTPRMTYNTRAKTCDTITTAEISHKSQNRT